MQHELLGLIVREADEHFATLSIGRNVAHLAKLCALLVGELKTFAPPYRNLRKGS